MAEGARGLSDPRRSGQIEPRRLTAWTALANLFLDTEHTEEIRHCLARDLRETGYSLAELEAILRNEIAPVFGGNLLSMAGEWALWGEDEIEPIMRRDFLGRSRLTFGQWLKGRLAYPLAATEWNRIAGIIAHDEPSRN
ncbi:hypothetical protein GRI42_06715 [Erythrobacter gaetbuli]|uniref:DUF7079 domain-containing protein n=1 Tax=Qipengyuania gaetbuli TaxID=266952 RepID=A0A844Y1K7_9SPHN|nr:hypothetical protein [Qipengyuania gaetbuli]MXO50992.1 hypothetical protein [Qipengyuania gaetbuli]